MRAAGASRQGTSELPAEQERDLGVRRVVRDAEQRRQVQVRPGRRPELEARPDQHLVVEVAAVGLGVDERDLDLGTDGEALVDERLADAARELVAALALAAGLLLPHEVGAPVPARHQFAAEQELALDVVGGLVDRDPLEVERRVAPDRVPVGQRPAHLELLLVDVQRAVVALLVRDEVDVELEALGQAELELVLDGGLGRAAVARDLGDQPVLELGRALGPHVDARLGEAPARGPLGLTVAADAVFLAQVGDALALDDDRAGFGRLLRPLLHVGRVDDLGVQAQRQRDRGEEAEGEDRVHSWLGVGEGRPPQRERDEGRDNARGRRRFSRARPAAPRNLLTAVPRMPKKDRPMQLALSSPLPSWTTATARFGAGLLRALQQATPTTALVENVWRVAPGVAPKGQLHALCDLPQLAAAGRVDVPLYLIGDDPLHLHQLRYVQQVPGVLLLPETQLGALQGCLDAAIGGRRLPYVRGFDHAGGLGAALAAMSRAVAVATEAEAQALRRCAPAAKVHVVPGLSLLRPDFGAAAARLCAIAAALPPAPAARSAAPAAPPVTAVVIGYNSKDIVGPC